MPLMLEVVSAHAQSMGPDARRILGDKELKIGREADNDWVFHQNYVSRHQAVIRCVNGMYFLEQTGNCPLAVNDPSRVIERNRIVRLSSGDRILIDDIEIRLQEIDSPPTSSIASPVDLLREVSEPLPPFPSMGAPVPGVGVNTRDDPLVILGIAQATSAPSQPSSIDVPKPNSPLEFALPELRPLTTPATPGPALSDNWWSKSAASAVAPQGGPRADFPEISPPRQPPPPSATVPPGAAPMSGTALPPSAAPPARAPASPPGPAATPSTGFPPSPAPSLGAPAAASAAQAAGAAPSLSLQELLKGAGLDANTQLPPEVAAQLGEALRIVVEGTRQVLQARNDIRREFRLPTTQVERKNNNPLKFSADASDALHKLLVQRSPAYLDTVRAFNDAFDDIRLHQAAMLAALRKAFEHMFRQFCPEFLESRLTQRGGGRGSVLGLGKPNLWELYAARYHEWAEDPDFAFRQLFGEEFGKAYEQYLTEQMQLLKAGPNG
jgi:type VI secretion system FHA domain protein